MRRLVDKGMYNKLASLRFAAASSARDLAYIEPASILPLVMSRFAQAVDHGTATHQLTSALAVLTFALRPMLSAPRETFFSEGFADAGVPDVGQFLAFVLETTLPGIDANDPSKTLSVIRLYVAVVSNLAVLADPGDPANAAADEVFPFQWSDWIDAALGRLFVLFENVDPASAGKIDGADKHGGGAGGDGGASYLMGSSSMYSPLVRLMFARMSPSLRERAVKRVANFVLTSTHSGLTHEVGQMVMAAATQAPEETYIFLTKPLLESLAAEVQDVASLAAERARRAEGDASVGHDAVVSPTKEAKLRWQTGLLGAALHYGGPKAVALAPEIRTVLRALFALCDEAKSLRLGEMAAHVSSLLCGALTGTYVVDLFAADELLDAADKKAAAPFPFPAKWSVSKVVHARDGRAPAAGATHAPRPFAWRAPAPESLAVAREMAEEFVHAPCDALLGAFGEGGDPATMPKERARTPGIHRRRRERVPPAHGGLRARKKAGRRRRRRRSKQRLRGGRPGRRAAADCAGDARARRARWRRRWPAQRRTTPRRSVWRSPWRRTSWRPATATTAGANPRFARGARTPALTKPRSATTRRASRRGRGGCWASTRSCGSCGARRRRRTTAAGRDRGPPRTRRTRGCWRRCAV